ncbi:MAG: ATP-grasp domain-containing protein [Oscillibacter sp.]|nr:ATP-grasp domain-containing protein [Oscillibacter sp.]
MTTVVVTDGKYRASIAAVRTLGRAGYRVVVTQTRKDSALPPPVFSSRYCGEGRWIEGAAADEEYPDRLLAVLREYERPVLFCVGAVTLNAVARQRERFSPSADFLIAPPEVLDALNDKEAVHRRCEELGIPVPRAYSAAPERYPVVIKPHCGEKFGLKARDRYRIAEDEASYRAALAAMAPYDPAPLVQERVTGDGAGASLLLGRDGALLGAICHRRVREYPITGGPSTCCESFYDPELIDRAYRLLRSFGFQGLAMVEFKGGYVLEVNPRIWGSFPLTACAGSPIAAHYARAAAGEAVAYAPADYTAGLRMRFLLNDTAALLSLLRHGRVGPFCAGVRDCFTAREALTDRDDPAPMRRYLRNTLLRR